MTDRSETEIQSGILKTLRRFGVWADRYQAGMVKIGGNWIHLGEAGAPDILVLDPYGWLEVKVPGGKPSEVQKRWHAKARARGIRVEVVTHEGEATRVVLKWRSDG